MITDHPAITISNSLLVFVFLFFSPFVVFLSKHHSDQMSEGSQVSKVTLQNSKVTLTHSLTEYGAARAAKKVK